MKNPDCMISDQVLMFTLWVNQSRTSCGLSLGRGINVCIQKWSRSHDQGGRKGYKNHKP